ncbi:hypothetical protein MSP8886_00199 [Marinomonas spartinae]|uniref:TIGR02646 family protein n=1 Tax=Marinomonas spartinae TaxID=1792290 RepID=A0A1A8T2J8_9GAMM|nr:hypothetical protein [Marinomonas spartinae]SBS25190.1 hypothetical protein MSP8886_00199 [Marinomonas spartinae]
MRKIAKRVGYEPPSLTQWKRKNPNKRYHQMDDSLKCREVRQDIRTACTQEQFFLCAYCCQAISGGSTDTMNEHVVARELDPNRTLDFTNIVASCRTLGQCDDSHQSQALPVTPFMDECETELKFKISGRVEGLSEDAITSIKILNLGDDEKNNKALIERRKRFVDGILWKNGIDPDDGLDDDELLSDLIDSMTKPHNGKLVPFTPVALNILRQWIV